MRLTLRPCSGADTRSLLLSLAAGTTTCSHLTTRRLTHTHRKKAQLCGAAGRAQEPAGRVGSLVAKMMSGK